MLYIGTLNAFVSVAAKEGVRSGLYKGTSATIFRCSKASTKASRKASSNAFAQACIKAPLLLSLGVLKLVASSKASSKASRTACYLQVVQEDIRGLELLVYEALS